MEESALKTQFVQATASGYLASLSVLIGEKAERKLAAPSSSLKLGIDLVPTFSKIRADFAEELDRTKSKSPAHGQVTV
jgi:hypothetical protein